MSTKSYLGSMAWSDACLPNGDGQCDGIVAQEEAHGGEECGCACHKLWDGESPTTVAGMLDFHRAYWHGDPRVIPSPTA